MARQKLSSGTAAAPLQLVPDAVEPAPEPVTANISEFLIDGTVAPTEAAWGSVITTITTLDVAATYRRLQEELVLGDVGDQTQEFAAVAVALMGADRNFFEAAKLERAAKLEEQRIDRDVETRLETLRTKASAELEAEKAAGTRSKAPTIQDIKDRVAANWPTLHNEICRQSEEIHAARAVCEQLTLAWRSRASSLRSMVERYAPNRLGA